MTVTDNNKTYKGGKFRDINFSVIKMEDDDQLKAVITTPTETREQVLPSWDTADKWVDNQIAKLATGGRYETR